MQEGQKQVEKSFNLRQKLVVVGIDIMLLVELTFSIYIAHRCPESITLVFLKTYLPIALTTIVIGLICIRILRSRGAVTCKRSIPAENEATV
jgi:hypothetical protein